MVPEAISKKLEPMGMATKLRNVTSKSHYSLEFDDIYDFQEVHTYTSTNHSYVH